MTPKLVDRCAPTGRVWEGVGMREQLVGRGWTAGVGDLATAGPTCAAAERRVATCVRVRGRRSGAEAFAQGLREPGRGRAVLPPGPRVFAV